MNLARIVVKLDKRGIQPIPTTALTPSIEYRSQNPITRLTSELVMFHV
jgi:hypothetical protein